MQHVVSASGLVLTLWGGLCDPGTGFDTCAPCPANTASDGLGPCVTCGVTEWAAGGAAACTPCPPGQWQVACIACLLHMLSS